MTTELTKRLQSAAKGKAPIVAIPIEGHAPVCLNRKRLAAWIKGVEIHSVEVITPNLEKYTFRKPGEDTGQVGLYEGPEERIVTLVPNTNNRSLKISGMAGHVKTRCRMFVVTRQAAALEIWNWAEKERAKNLKVIGQGAISTVALKEAKKAAKAKERAAKLIEMERGGSDELEEAKAEVLNILDDARAHGRGPEKHINSQWEQRDAEEKKAEIIVRHVSHHNLPRRMCKRVAVIRWRMKALKAAWFEVTKYNPHRRRTTANKFLKVKKAIRVIQIVADYMTLKAKLLSILPQRIPHPRWPDEHVFAIDPINRPDRKEKDNYYQHSYDREVMAKRLRIARETIRVLTPPPDSEEMDIAA